MRVYEYNGPGNDPGPDDLQCPDCGNCSLMSLHRQMETHISFSQGEVQVQPAPLPHLIKIRPGDQIWCPTCDIEMLPHKDVVDQHRAEQCIGCPICGDVYPDVYAICRECVLSHGYPDCRACKYDYSREVQEIDPVEIREVYEDDMHGNLRFLRQMLNEGFRQKYVSARNRSYYFLPQRVPELQHKEGHCFEDETIPF